MTIMILHNNEKKNDDSRDAIPSNKNRDEKNSNDQAKNCVFSSLNEMKIRLYFADFEIFFSLSNCSHFPRGLCHQQDDDMESSRSPPPPTPPPRCLISTWKLSPQISREGKQRTFTRYAPRLTFCFFFPHVKHHQKGEKERSLFKSFPKQLPRPTYYGYARSLCTNVSTPPVSNALSKDHEW